MNRFIFAAALFLVTVCSSAFAEESVVCSEPNSATWTMEKVLYEKILKNPFDDLFTTNWYVDDKSGCRGSISTIAGKEVAKSWHVEIRGFIMVRNALRMDSGDFLYGDLDEEIILLWDVSKSENEGERIEGLTLAFTGVAHTAQRRHFDF
jgi:hypothetical protein